MYNDLDVNYYTEYNSFFIVNANRYYAKIFCTCVIQDDVKQEITGGILTQCV